MGAIATASRLNLIDRIATDGGPRGPLRLENEGLGAAMSKKVTTAVTSTIDDAYIIEAKTQQKALDGEEKALRAASQQ